MIARSKEKDLKDKLQQDVYNNVRPATSTSTGATSEGVSERVSESSEPLEEFIVGGSDVKRTKKHRQHMNTHKSMRVSMSMAPPPQAMADMMHGGGGGGVSDGVSDGVSGGVSGGVSDGVSDGVSGGGSDASVPQHPLKHSQSTDSTTSLSGSTASSGYSFTTLPQRLQDSFESLVGGSTLRPTVVTVSE